MQGSLIARMDALEQLRDLHGLFAILQHGSWEACRIPRVSSVELGILFGLTKP
jgi:hypothetical protein